MLEEAGPSSLLRTAILFSFVVLLTFIYWAQKAEIDEVSVASGEVIPSGAVQTIQHIDGGTISEIATSEGDIVKKGQILVRLDPTNIRGELKQLETQMVIWELKGMRLKAFAENQKITGSIANPCFTDLLKEQRNLLAIQQLDLKNQQSVLLTQIEQRRSEFSLLQEQILILAAQIKPLQEQLKIREGLLKSSTLSRFDFLDSQRQFLQEQGKLDELGLKQKSAEQAIQEAVGRLDELNSRLKKEALNEMASANAETLKIEEKLIRLSEALGRLNIVSPVDGVIQGMDVNSVGTVIQPGNPILSIVPIDQELIVETRIRPEDIGFLQLGQTATVKFTTYNYSRCGSVEGELTHISATTFEDEQGESFYKGKVALSQSFVGSNPERNLILPGMTATTDIHSGKKTLLDYLLKPIHTTLTQSFRER
ncbi:MAG: HlyD family type I secretion periplasmic adaptor subunit [Sneathiella sp.]|nr:HlyD family type I secretion periplasmic adaptor subunit [Sneathiella sp.]